MLLGLAVVSITTVLPAASVRVVTPATVASAAKPVEVTVVPASVTP